MLLPLLQEKRKKERDEEKKRKLRKCRLLVVKWKTRLTVSYEDSGFGILKFCVGFLNEKILKTHTHKNAFIALDTLKTMSLGYKLP